MLLFACCTKRKVVANTDADTDTVANADTDAGAGAHADTDLFSPPSKISDFHWSGNPEKYTDANAHTPPPPPHHTMAIYTGRFVMKQTMNLFLDLPFIVCFPATLWRVGMVLRKACRRQRSVYWVGFELRVTH